MLSTVTCDQCQARVTVDTDVAVPPLPRGWLQLNVTGIARHFSSDECAATWQARDAAEREAEWHARARAREEELRDLPPVRVVNALEHEAERVATTAVPTPGASK